MSNLASTVLNKQNISSPGKKKLLLQYQPRGQVSTFSKLFAEQVFYRFTGKKAPQMQIISYIKAGRSLPNINNWLTELERKQNIKSSISTECICEFTARGECLMYYWGLWCIAFKWSEKTPRRKPQATNPDPKHSASQAFYLLSKQGPWYSP